MRIGGQPHCLDTSFLRAPRSLPFCLRPDFSGISELAIGNVKTQVTASFCEPEGARFVCLARKWIANCQPIDRLAISHVLGVKGAGVGMERSRDDERIKDGIPVSLGNVHGSLVGRNCKWHGLRTKDAK